MRNNQAFASALILASALSACGAGRTVITSTAPENDMHRDATAGWIGCMPDHIQIADVHTSYDAADLDRWVTYWTATCAGETFVCSAAGAAMHCAPLRAPSSAAAESTD